MPDNYESMDDIKKNGDQISVPASASSSSASTSVANEREDTKKRVLIVDDDEDIAFTFKKALENTKRFAVDHYSDSEEALSNFRPAFYDLLLLDIKMPKMNGFELYNEMRKKRLICQERVCFITAFEIYYETLNKEFPQLDVGCFIKKPIEVGDLIERVEMEIKSKEQ